MLGFRGLRFSVLGGGSNGRALMVEMVAAVVVGVLKIPRCDQSSHSDNCNHPSN